MGYHVIEYLSIIAASMYHPLFCTPWHPDQASKELHGSDRSLPAQRPDLCPRTNSPSPQTPPGRNGHVDPSPRNSLPAGMIHVRYICQYDPIWSNMGELVPLCSTKSLDISWHFKKSRPASPRWCKKCCFVGGWPDHGASEHPQHTSWIPDSKRRIGAKHGTVLAHSHVIKLFQLQNQIKSNFSTAYTT